MKFKNATKKIAAVSAAVSVLASSAFAGLTDYPNNFVKDGKFVGQVVVGSSADVADSNAASALIDDLKADLGSSDKVKITYRMGSKSGSELPAVKSNSEVNFNEDLQDSLETSLDDSDSKLLEDGKLKKEDYTQKFKPTNGGKFERAYESKVDDMDEQEVGIFLKDGSTFAEYELEFDNDLDLTSSDERAKYVGEKFDIMGNEFVVSDIKATEIILVGGSNKISLGEGESSSVSVEGKSYDVAIQSVSNSKVLLTVNGQSKSIDEFDSENVAGVSVVVTDIVSSNRDSVKGYAEIVVGGQEIKLKANGEEVEVNEEDVSDIHDGYSVESTITAGAADTIKKISLTYKVDDDVFLKAGDSLDDVLFGAFMFNLESIENDDDKASFRLEASTDKLDMNLVSSKGYEYSLDEVVSVNSGNDDVALHGADEDDAFFTLGNAPGAHDTAALAPAHGVTFETPVLSGTNYNISVGSDLVAADVAVGGKFVYDNKAFVLTASGDIDGDAGHGLSFSKASQGIRFITGDSDEAVVYEVKSYSKSDNELTIKKISKEGSDIRVKPSNIASKLDMPGAAVESVTNGVIIAGVNLQSKLRLANDLEVNLNNVESSDTIDFTYHSDLDMDDSNEAEEIFKVTIDKDGDDDMTLVPSSPGANWGTLDKSQTKTEKGSDLRKATSSLGATLEWDTDDKRYVEVMVPKKQVRAEVSYSTGGSTASTMTKVVSADSVADTKSELEKEGYKIVGTEAMDSVDVEVSAPMSDAEVSDMSNMIVVGGPAVNSAARKLLGIEDYSMDQAGVAMGEGRAKYFADSNSLLVYGYSAADTKAIVDKVVAGSVDIE